MQLTGLLFYFLGSAIGSVVCVPDLINVLCGAILGVKFLGGIIGFPVFLHQIRHHAVKQVEDTGAVAVDQRCRHTDDLLRDVEDFAHGVALTAVV
ncbi:hypothetical protein SDC9_122814 [bioreactor metagenome]|uniref:Uncharacterized protein n=1 Tax=bioreactor metagenome TaxID=1076179 RepID=A0A645CFW0_9ZZZZ